MKREVEKIINASELRVIRSLNTPHKIQNFLDTIPFNLEKKGETYMSPRRVLRARRAHCFEGAVFAFLCLRYHGYASYLLDLKVHRKFRKKGLDSDHVLALFEMHGHWGAVSKTNHAVLRWRDPIYKSPREIAMSYFHEYFIKKGEKTLELFSEPYDVFKSFSTDWITCEDDLDHIAHALDVSPHTPFVPRRMRRYIRNASPIEVKASTLVEWRKK